MPKPKDRADLFVYNTEVEVRTPYNADFISELKSSIDAGDREYVPEGRFWIVVGEHLAQLRRICERYFVNVEVRYCYDAPHSSTSSTSYATEPDCSRCSYRMRSDARRAVSTPLPGQGDTSAHDVLFLRAGAPDAVIDAVYRALAKEYHPDVNPRGADTMVRINKAYQTLKGGRK